MVTEIEQFTAPGKFYIDLAMEMIKDDLENPRHIYLGIIRGFIELGEKGLFKNNPYYKYQNTYNGSFSE